MKIYKYPIEITDLQEILLPEGAAILTVQVQDNRLFLWAMLGDRYSDVVRKIEVIGTGNPIPELPHPIQRRYIGTVQMPPFVWHVFERSNPVVL